MDSGWKLSGKEAGEGGSGLGVPECGGRGMLRGQGKGQVGRGVGKKERERKGVGRLGIFGWGMMLVKSESWLLLLLGIDGPYL